MPNPKQKLKKYLMKFIALLLVTTLISSTSLGNIAEAVAKMPKLSITGTTNVFVGNKLNINIKNTPTNTKQSWSSSNEKVATVNKKGIVKGIKAGNTTITCKLTVVDKTYTLKGKVKVTQGVTNLSLSNKGSGKKLIVGDTFTFKAAIEPTKVSDKITWSSNDTSIAKISKKGKVTALKVGKAKITAKTASGKKASVKVSVTDKITVATQKELNEALKKNNLTKIIIKTDKPESFSISKVGNYPNTSLVVNAPNSDVTNEGSVFNNIIINKIKPSTFIEKGKGNKFDLRAPHSRLIIVRGAEVKDISLIGAKSEIIVEGVINGNITFMSNTQTPPELILSGTTTSEVNVVINRLDSKLITTIKVLVKLIVNAELTFDKGSEGSIVEKANEDIKEIIHNNTGDGEAISVNVDKEEPTTNAPDSGNSGFLPGIDSGNNEKPDPQPLAPEDQGTIVTIANVADNVVAPMYIDSKGKDYKGLKLVAESFGRDVNLITGKTTPIYTDSTKLNGTVIIAGSIGNNDIIDKLIADGKINVSNVKDKWEVYQINIVDTPITGVNKAIVITGSDKRGVMYGIYHISELMGISPWVYWGDVEPVKHSSITFETDELEITSKEPSVKYRGIFLNNEAPSLSSWVQKFGGKGYNEEFYELVFELLLRLKGNYLWPAMWNNAFAQDGKLTSDASLKLANEYGIVMGTSHHEPMMRAEQEFFRNKFGNGEWNYATNKDGLNTFWNEAAVRGKGIDSLITLGMRGAADSPMLPDGTVEDNVNLLKDIIIDQKKILKDNGYTDEPTILTIYKEVEEFWYGVDGIPGLKDWDVLDDVTIMLTGDNQGNLRTLPTEENKNRKAGWGMYFHFDYHGGPRSYEWVNTVPLTRIWEQMTMAYDFGVKEVWMVNVGDLKPMEMNISYFLDLAYDFNTYGTSNIDSANDYIEKWTNQQFGNYTDNEGLQSITDMLAEYVKINGSRKPEIVNSSTYSIENYNEAMTMLNRLDSLIKTADDTKSKIAKEAEAAYYQLVYYPAVASANVHRMQIYSGINQLYYKQKRTSANLYGYLLNEAIQLDKDLMDTYNENMPGVGNKWSGMMKSNHVGYTAWNDVGWSYPTIRVLESELQQRMLIGIQGSSIITRSGSISLPDFTSTNQEVYYIDIANSGGEAFDYTITTDKDFIILTKKNGTIISQDTIGISIDYSKITENSNGKITIEGANETVNVLVKANVTDISGLSPKTFVEEHDYISIEAKNFSNNQAGTNGAKWTEIKNYGRTESSFKVFPLNKANETTENAPYLEYKVFVKEAGEYTLQTYIAPSNNIDWNYIGMKYGVKVNSNDIIKVDTLNKDEFKAGKSKLWDNYVMDNIRITKSTHTLTAGENTIRIYSIDPELVLQKLVLYKTSKGLKTSYFGPPESYYVGKTVKSSLVTDIQEQLYILPAVIPKSAMPTNVLVPQDDNYLVSVKASSTSASTVNVLWNGKSIGTVQVSGQGTYNVTGAVVMTYGKGTLTYEVKSGDAIVESIQITLQNPTVRYQVPTTTKNNEFYLDLNESRIAGTASINDNVPDVNVKENEVTFKFTEWKQRVNLELDLAQVAMVKKATDITVEITGTSSTEAKFRYSLGDPSTQQDWNGTSVTSLNTFSNILKNTLSFSGNIDKNGKVYDYLILQLGNPNNPPETITSGDVTIQSIKIICNIPEPIPEPENPYEVPDSNDENEFYLDLNDCRTLGNTTGVDAGVQAPVADIQRDKVTYSFTKKDQRLFIKLTSEQKAKVLEAKSIKVFIDGSSSEEANYRWCLGKPNTQENWNGTVMPTPVGVSSFFNTILSAEFNTVTEADTLTKDYLIIQLRSEGVSPDVTINSIKLILVPKDPIDETEDSGPYEVPTSNNDNEFYLDLNECTTVGNTTGIDEGVLAPEAQIKSDKVIYSFTTKDQRLFIKLSKQQKAKVLEGKSIQIMIDGSSSVEAEYRGCLGKPTQANNNWNGTDMFGPLGEGSFFNTTLSVGFNTVTEADTMTKDYLIIQLRSNITPDVTINSIKLTVVQKDSPEEYQTPTPEGADEFYLNLNECKADGYEATAKAPYTAISTNKIIALLGTNNQKLYIKLTDEQIDKIKNTTADKIKVTINGKSSVSAKYRMAFVKPDAGSNWNGTTLPSFENVLIFNTAGGTFDFANGTPTDTSRLGYFMLHLQSTLDADVTIESIKITINQ